MLKYPQKSTEQKWAQTKPLKSFGKEEETLSPGCSHTLTAVDKQLRPSPTGSQPEFPVP